MRIFKDLELVEQLGSDVGTRTKDGEGNKKRLP
jgi:hypothetical protein